MTQPFTGLLVDHITHVTDDGELDLISFAHLVRNTAFADVSAVTVLATSGAGLTFDRAERQLVVQTAVESALMVGTSEGVRESVMPAYAAVSAPSTLEVVRLAQDAERAGAVGQLLAPFSYLPLSDAEVRALFMAVAETTALPICFYNKPVQTQDDVSPAILAANARMVSVKRPCGTTMLPAASVISGTQWARSFSIGLSADVQLLADLPEVDAWHSGPAGLLPGEYAEVWCLARKGGPQGASLARLQSIAQALAGMPHAIGALHALSNVIGVPTAGPRGPFTASTQEEIWQLSSAINIRFRVR